MPQAFSLPAAPMRRGPRLPAYPGGAAGGRFAAARSPLRTAFVISAAKPSPVLETACGGPVFPCRRQSSRQASKGRVPPEPAGTPSRGRILPFRAFRAVSPLRGRRSIRLCRREASKQAFRRIGKPSLKPGANIRENPRAAAHSEEAAGAFRIPCPGPGFAGLPPSSCLPRPRVPPGWKTSFISRRPQGASPAVARAKAACGLRARRACRQPGFSVKLARMSRTSRKPLRASRRGTGPFRP